MTGDVRDALADLGGRYDGGGEDVVLWRKFGDDGFVGAYEGWVRRVRGFRSSSL